ncbi:hypothetical protein [Yinghuangia seranimata]|uniref:hypothetical protein n=1 Tax=Yinghuangia seranimata TaxID=408067 RepID=UPI00248CB7A4|nr:hypothetical protein [Yinghuangia seranimata]MDI2128762.1 hypothetical protein [Yinghuangia seranimata]
MAEEREAARGRGEDAAAGRQGAPARRVSGRDLFGFDGADLLPDRTADERDAGWGDERGTASDSAADLRRFLDEKPPHHL